jgi:hypothetical protein
MFSEISYWDDDIADDLVAPYTGISALTDCPIDGISDYDEETYLPILESFEKTFDCAGLYNAPIYFLF